MTNPPTSIRLIPAARRGAAVFALRAAVAAFVLAGAVPGAEIGGAAFGAEIALEPAECRDLPADCALLAPIEDGAEVWENGGEVLSPRATTYQAAVATAAGELDVFFALDYSNANALLPDILFWDADGDMAIGEGERFALEPTQGGGHPLAAGKAVLRATKIPAGAPAGAPAAGGAPVLASVFAFVDPEGVRPDEPILLGVKAWARLAGTMEIDGEAYDVALKDRNLSGTYTDFDAGEDAGACDALIVAPAGALDGPLGPREAALYERPLRGKIAAAGKAFSVAAADGGRRVTLARLAPAMGTAATASPVIEAALFSPEWGAVTMPAAMELALPAGEWEVQSFRRLGPRPGAFCAYFGPLDVRITVREGARAAIELDTALVAKIQGKRNGKHMILALDMATAQGARFDKYADPGAAEPLKGVPFTVAGKDGRAVLADVFKFG